MRKFFLFIFLSLWMGEVFAQTTAPANPSLNNPAPPPPSEAPKPPPPPEQKPPEEAPTTLLKSAKDLKEAEEQEELRETKRRARSRKYQKQKEREEQHAYELEKFMYLRKYMKQESSKGEGKDSAGGTAPPPQGTPAP